MSDKPKMKPLTRGKASKKPEREPPVRGKPSVPSTAWYQDERLKWLILLVMSIMISILLFPNFLSKPEVYNLGDVAARDIKASRDFLIENKELTEKNMDKAVKEVLSVYDFDSSGSNLIPRIKDAFAAGRVFHADTVSAEKQEQPSPPAEEAGTKDTGKKAEEDNIQAQFFGTLEITSDQKLFHQLVEMGFPAQVEDAIVLLTSGVLKRGVVGNKPMLKSQIERGGIILHQLNSKKETTETDLNRFYDLESAKTAIETGRDDLLKSLDSPEEAEVALKLAVSLIKPNLTFNQRETEARKDLARKSVNPIYFKIKKGEMIVREGELISQDHLLKLSEQTKSQSGMDMLSRVPGMTILIGFLFSVMYLVTLKGTRFFKGDGKDVIFNSVTLLGVFVFLWAYHFIAEEVARGFHFFSVRTLLFAMPVACGAMLISVFEGLAVAVAFSLAISVLAALLTGGQVEYFVYFFVNSLVAAYGVRNYNERGILIKTGLMVGLVNIFLSLSIVMIYDTLYTLEAFISATSGFVGGILAGVIASGILPLVEMSFGFTTDIKLLELANLDQPLLREFMVQSPGSYHHSVIISNMVEATAKAVHANPLLARVSAYYHDIGKMKKPLYFIENQTGENKHEKLAPSMSSLILIAHVKDGVELAKRHKLGREIIDIIQQHHGTSLISYFYHKAKERMVMKGSKSVEVNEEDFRYPGPKPQTKEAGLVMLADMVEAASRSLRDPNPARIQGMVQKIINKVFSDGQLDECELTLKDLHQIAKSFNKTLSGIFHHRVEYPEAVARAPKKVKDGNSDQFAAEDSRPEQPEDKEEVEKSLRRLGLS